MRTRAAFGGILASACILLLGWQLGNPVGGPGTPAAPGAATGAGSSGTGPSGTSPAPADGATTADATADGTYTGAAEGTRFGDVQVQVTIAGGSITEVTALQLTDADGRSTQISNRAAPILRQEVLASQSAQVANVSGATYTTQAYLTSVQSALDQAGF